MRTIWVAAAAAVLVAAVPNPAGLAQTPGPLSAKTPDAAALTAAAQSRGYVPIIVEFASAAPRNIAPAPDAIAEARSAIALERDAVVARHFGDATRPRPGAGFSRALRTYQVAPMFALNVSATELNALAADPQVLRIHENKRGRTNLIQSVPLIGMTGASGAYALGATGAGQAVAIVDTGIQLDHEFVVGKVAAEACFSSGETLPQTASLCPNGTNAQTGAGSASAETAQCVTNSFNICEHGTHVAGIAAGLNTNPQGGEPPNGVAKNAMIVAVQVFTRFNNRSDCFGSAPCVLYWTSDVLAGLDWLFANALVLPNDVRLAAVNMSLDEENPRPANAPTCDDHVLKTPVDHLLGAGVATAIAAGNQSSRTGVSAPGCISTAVTVSATTKADAISWFSNMSPTVDLLAPGSSILSSVPVVPHSTSFYGSGDGTSMAAPHVTGAFAAMRSFCPSASVSQMLSALQATGLPVSDTRSGGVQTKPRIRVANALAQLACSRKVAHDFDGNGKSDIAWRDTSGNTGVWLMNGTTVSAAAGLGQVGGAWAIFGQRDFDGDGKHDLLWKDASGNVAIWFMNGASVASISGVANVGANWNVVGSGDFNGDGKGDILWRDASGNVAIWLMNGTTISNSAGLGNPGGSWNVAGVGDFNGDGRADVVWKDASGNVVIWFMSGTAVSSSSFVGNVGSNWNIAATGDFDGDGKADIVWRDTSGNIAVSLMNGATISSTVGLGNPGGTWAIQETGDFDGDGKADILWKDASGIVAIWFMSGTTITSSAGIANVGPNWTVQTAGAN